MIKTGGQKKPLMMTDVDDGRLILMVMCYAGYDSYDGYIDTNGYVL